MALITLTFPPGSCASISKQGQTWTVDSVNTTEVVITVDDADNDGTISNDEWDAAIGNGGGNDQGSTNYLYEGTGSSGQLYATDGSTFTPGQDVSDIMDGVSNNFETDVDAVVCFVKGTLIKTISVHILM